MRTKWTWPRALLGASLPALLALGTLNVPGCVEEEPAPLTWPARDVLGVSPAWLVERISVSDRHDLRERFIDGALEQVEDSGVDVAVSGDALRHGEQLMAFDTLREAGGELPLFFLTFAKDADGGAIATPCALTIADFEEPTTPIEGAAHFLVDTSFDDAVVVQPGTVERELLDNMLPTLSRWFERCNSTSNAVGSEGPSQFIAPTLDLVRADGAPALMAYWPASRTLYLNPIALVLFGEVVEDGLQTVQQPLPFELPPLHMEGVDACTNNIRLYCGTCDTPEKVSQARQGDPNACVDALFVEGEVWENCERLNFNVAQGFFRYCLNEYMREFTVGGRPYDVPGCLASKSGNDGRDLNTVCDARFVGTADDLDAAYIGFIEPASSGLCQESFVSCIPDPSTQQPPAPGNTGGGGGDSCDSCGDDGGGGSSCDTEHGCGLDDVCDEDGQ